MYDYDAFYKKYPVNQHDQPERHSKVAELIKGTVFDIGCGAGMLSDYYAGPYFGFDISSVAVEKARGVRRADATFAVCDCTKLEGVELENADTIVLSEFLEHIEDDSTIFEKIMASARPGTRIIITVPNFDRIPCDEHVRTFTIPQLRKKLKPYGKVKFYNWPGAHVQILCTVDIGQKNTDDLSLVMIVKDEEKGLERAILSCIEFVDNIIIAVDRSSTDKTIAIADMYADTPKSFTWRDDFAAARNYAHQGVETKWILFLDGHEYVEKSGDLEKALALDKGGLYCSVEMENGFVFRNPRIYRQGVEFVGAVHEKQQCGDTALLLDFLIKHDRLGGQAKAASDARDRQRCDMVPRIMGEMYRKDKKNIRAIFHLGLYHQSRKNFRTAIRWYNRYLKHSKNNGERWFVFFQKALCHLGIKQRRFALRDLSFADKETPDRWEVQKLRGLIHFDQHYYETAIIWLVESFHANEGDVTYKPFPHDDAGSWNIIGECFFRLGQHAKAATAFETAAERAKNKMQKQLFTKRAEVMVAICKN